MTPATLTTIRREMGLSKSALAEALGVSRNTIGDYEAGKSPIPRYIALAVTCIYRRLPAVE